MNCEVGSLIRTEDRNSNIKAVFLEKKKDFLLCDLDFSPQCEEYLWSRSPLPSVGSTALGQQHWNRRQKATKALCRYSR